MRHPEDPLGTAASAASRGDRNGTEVLLAALGPAIVAVVRAVLGACNPDVEDATQEAMLAVVRALPSFRGECTVRHYAVRIAVRSSLLMRRRQQTNRVVSADVEISAEGPTTARAASSTAMNAEQELAAARRRAALRELLDRLPEEQAEALTMRVVLGLSLEEVAETSGVPINTVRSRVRLAKEAMRRHLERTPVLAEAGRELLLDGSRRHPPSAGITWENQR